VLPIGQGSRATFSPLGGGGGAVSPPPKRHFMLIGLLARVGAFALLQSHIAPGRVGCRANEEMAGLHPYRLRKIAARSSSVIGHGLAGSSRAFHQSH